MSSRIPEQLKDKTALVVGCGGLGGYVVEHLVRIGMGKIIIADHDCFCHSNLNRQLISNLENIGLSKVQEAKKRAFSINKAVQIIPIEEKVDKTNIQKIAMGCDIVFDCSDNVPTRLILEEYCEEKNLPLIHGAIGDLCGQVAAVYPGDRTLSKLYKDFSEKKLPTVSYVPALVASLQVSEGVKALIGESQLRGKTMIIDLSTNYIKIIGSEEGR